MKIVIISSSDLHGGAARAAYRLHRSLIDEKIDSTIVVQKKLTDDFTVIGPSSRIKAVFEGLRPAMDHIIMKLIKAKTLFSSSYLPFSSIIQKVNTLNPDIVHLHWVAGGTIRIEDLEKIKAPIIWSCHDMWAFTGGCHYDDHCQRYENECGKCKVLNSNKENDISRKVFNRKKSIYSKLDNLSIICSSQWLTKCASDSSLFKDKQIYTLPNCINTKLFRPIDKDTCRDMFNIPKDKKVILFGAMNSLSDNRKGAKELFEALNYLDLEDTVFVIAGSSKPKEDLKLKYPVYFISPLFDDVALSLMYNVANVMVVPSLQENLANSIVESISCGIPVVAFNIGGNKDIIEHRVDGYLSEESSSKDLANGIKWILENKNYSHISLNARKKALEKFDAHVVVKQYIDLYKNIKGKK